MLYVVFWAFCCLIIICFVQHKEEKYEAWFTEWYSVISFPHRKSFYGEYEIPGGKKISFILLYHKQALTHDDHSSLCQMRLICSESFLSNGIWFSLFIAISWSAWVLLGKISISLKRLLKTHSCSMRHF